MAATPIVLILGAGANIGAHVARAFAAKGYKVAVSSRTSPQPSINPEGFFHIPADLSDPDAVDSVFAKVRQALGGSPSVVVYNCAQQTSNPANDPLSLSVSDLTRALSVNTMSALAAAHQATLGFESLPSTASKTFIYTGNRLNIAPILPLLSLGMSKSATAHMIASASQAYKDKGYKFYYADERKEDGSPPYRAISGEAHGKFYTELAEQPEQIPWLATFVKDIGYVKF